MFESVNARTHRRTDAGSTPHLISSPCEPAAQVSLNPVSSLFSFNVAFKTSLIRTAVFRKMKIGGLTGILNKRVF